MTDHRDQSLAEALAEIKTAAREFIEATRLVEESPDATSADWSNYYDARAYLERCIDDA